MPICDSIMVQAPNGKRCAYMYAQWCLHGDHGAKSFRVDDKLVFKCPTKMYTGSCLGCSQGSVHYLNYQEAKFILDETSRADTPATHQTAHVPSSTGFTLQGQSTLEDAARDAMQKIQSQQDAALISNVPFLSALSHLAAGGNPGVWRLPLGTKVASPAAQTK